MQAKKPAPSAKGKTTNAPGAVPRPDMSSKEWIHIPSLSSATTNRSGANTIANKVKHDGRTSQNVGGGLRAPNTNNAGEGTPVRDVETGALVWGGDDRVVVSYEDGLTVTRHADGTVQRWWREKGDGGGSTPAGLVLVECPGFASVEVRKSSKL